MCNRSSDMKDRKVSFVTVINRSWLKCSCSIFRSKPYNSIYYSPKYLSLLWKVTVRSYTIHKQLSNPLTNYLNHSSCVLADDLDRFDISFLPSFGFLKIVHFPACNYALLDLALVGYPKRFYRYNRGSIEMSEHCTLLLHPMVYCKSDSSTRSIFPSDFLVFPLHLGSQYYGYLLPRYLLPHWEILSPTWQIVSQYRERLRWAKDKEYNDDSLRTAKILFYRYQNWDHAAEGMWTPALVTNTVLTYERGRNNCGALNLNPTMTAKNSVIRPPGTLAALASPVYIALNEVTLFSDDSVMKFGVKLWTINFLVLISFRSTTESIWSPSFSPIKYFLCDSN